MVRVAQAVPCRATVTRTGSRRAPTPSDRRRPAVFEATAMPGLLQPPSRRRWRRNRGRARARGATDAVATCPNAAFCSARFATQRGEIDERLAASKPQRSRRGASRAAPPRSELAHLAPAEVALAGEAEQVVIFVRIAIRIDDRILPEVVTLANAARLFGPRAVATQVAPCQHALPGLEL